MAITGLKFNGIFNVEGKGPGGQNILYANRMIAGSVTYDVETEDVEGHVDGSCIAQVLDTIRTRETFTMSLETRDIDSSFLELIMDERWATAGSYEMPYINTAKANASGVVSDSEITGTLNATTVHVSIVSSSSAGLMRPLQVITTGTPTAEQALVENGQITLAATNANQSVKYSVAKTYTNVDTLGFVTNGVALSDMSFAAQLCTNTNELLYMRVRSMTKSGGFEFDLKGENNATLEYTLKALPGFRKPIEFLRRIPA